MEDSTKYAIAAAAGAAAIGAGIYYRREIGQALPALPKLPDLPGVSAPSPSYAQRLLTVIYGLLPEPASTLEEPDARWDWILGGRTGKDIWGYYQWATNAKYGTTCGIFAAACMSAADWPRELINRRAPEGSGYKPTWHIARIHEGAVALGWLWNWEKDHPVLASPPKVAGWGALSSLGAWEDPARAFLAALEVGQAGGPPLVPGDVYCQTRDYTDSKGVKRRNEHVGIVLTIDRDGDAWRCETADGGQTSPKTGRQMAARVKRRLRGSTFTNLQNGAVGDMRWLARSQGSPK